MLPLLSLRVSYFPCYIEASLDSKLEHIFFQKEKKTKKKKFPNIFQSILFQMDKCNLFLSTNILLFYVLIILIHHSCYSLVSSVKKRNFMLKGKLILSQAAWLFFRILCQMHIFFKRLIIYQNGITVNISNT